MFTFAFETELSIFEWNKNLWLDGYMGMVHGNIECMERAWVFLSEFYRPIGKFLLSI